MGRRSRRRARPPRVTTAGPATVHALKAARPSAPRSPGTAPTARAAARRATRRRDRRRAGARRARRRRARRRISAPRAKASAESARSRCLRRAAPALPRPSAWPRIARARHFLVVDLARLLGKARADVLGAAHDLAQLRDQLRRECPAIRLRAAGRRAARWRSSPFGHAHARRRQRARPSRTSQTGQRTRPRACWRVELLARGEPALEAVALRAGEVVDDHGALTAEAAGR